MARPARSERSRSARPSRQLSRFYHSINPDRVFGTHNRRGWSAPTTLLRPVRSGDRHAAVLAVDRRRLADGWRLSERGIREPKNDALRPGVPALALLKGRRLA